MDTIEDWYPTILACFIGRATMEEITFTSQLLQYAVTGITVGSIYAMVALGFNIIYNVTEIINMAQGEFVMLGGSHHGVPACGCGIASDCGLRGYRC